jgi:hypothetical protein
MGRIVWEATDYMSPPPQAKSLRSVEGFLSEEEGIGLGRRWSEGRYECVQEKGVIGVRDEVQMA